MSWENGIYGMIPKDDWLSIPFNPTRQNDPVDSLFGDEKTDNLTASWENIAAEYQLPAMAQFHAFDTKTNTTYRLPVDNRNIEKGLIKVKINQSERLQALLKTGVRDDAMYNYVVQDGARLAEQVFTRTKVAKNEVLATGKFTIVENNLNLTVDYGVKSEQTSFVLDLSSTADISSQLQNIIETAEEMGKTITGMITSKKNITKMRRNAGLQKEINSNVGVGALIRSADLSAYLEDEFGITTIITNDLRYNANNNIIGADGRPVVVTKRYFPDDKITFFASTPNNRLGIGLWGDPPSVINPLMTASASNVSPYVYIDQFTENDPAVLWTRASGLFVPVIYDPSTLFIATTNGISLDKTAVTLAAEGTATLTATTTPAGATVTWSTSDEDVATVSDGTVTAVAVGKATITATTEIDGHTYTASCVVTVSAGV